MHLRALLVDDEPLAREELRYLLELGRVKIVGEADNGVAALEMMTALTPDLVFLDVQMPGLTGFQVARRLVDLPLNVHVIFVTAFDQHAIEAFEVNAIDYLLKPVDPVTFLLAPLLLLSVGAVAGWAPARRAVRLNPVEALKCD